MEKAIIIIYCFVFGVSCSETKNDEPSTKIEPVTENKSLPKGFCSELLESKQVVGLAFTEVQWMYLDDSLKNICRPLNFRLPWMASDINGLPEIITPEIYNLSPVKTFEIIAKGKDSLNDSIYYFHYQLKKDFCNCDIYRFYKGNPKNKNFSGYYITEQIICNARLNETDLGDNLKLELKVKEEKDSTKYEMHGHEH